MSPNVLRAADQLGQPWTLRLIALFVYAGVGLILFFIDNVTVRVVGWAVLAGSALLVLVPSRRSTRPPKSASLARTYRLKVPASQSYPHYQIPPAEDVLAPIRLGCAPLLDCAWPLVLRAIDPAAWARLERSHGISVDIKILDFSKLFAKLQEPPDDGGIDLAIASAISVDRAQFDLQRARASAGAPVAILPILQQFNAYYLFARRAAVIRFFEEREQHHAADRARSVDAGSSLLRELKDPRDTIVEIKAEHLIGELMRAFKLHIERGADLDAAAVAFASTLGGSRSEDYLTFATPVHQSINDSFEAFCRADEPALFMGGLAQTAFLRGRSVKDSEFLVVAGPQDIDYHNLNSLVSSREFAKESSDVIFRFLGWWFDALNVFRRDILFAQDSAPETYNKALNAIKGGIEDADERIPLLPASATVDDADRALAMMRIHSPDEEGSYLLPNIHEAYAVQDDLTERLRKLQAAVAIVQAVEESSRSTFRSPNTADEAS